MFLCRITKSRLKALSRTRSSQRGTRTRCRKPPRQLAPVNFSALIIGMASTTKILPALPGAKAARQNRGDRFRYHGDTTTHAATFVAQSRPCGRPNTTACRRRQRSRALLLRRIHLFPTTLITSEIRPTMLNPDSSRANRSSGTKIPSPSFSSSGFGK